MKTLLDLENWNRKEHYVHFKQMQEPFFGVTLEIDCTKAYQKSKTLSVPFYIYYLHKTLVAVNAIECFRYRINGDQIYIYDQIDASATISREDDTFGFSLMEYTPDLSLFVEKATAEIARIQNTTGLFTRSFDTDNLIHFSALP